MAEPIIEFFKMINIYHCNGQLFPLSLCRPENLRQDLLNRCAVMDLCQTIHGGAHFHFFKCPRIFQGHPEFVGNNRQRSQVCYLNGLAGNNVVHADNTHDLVVIGKWNSSHFTDFQSFQYLYFAPALSFYQYRHMLSKTFY